MNAPTEILELPAFQGASLHVRRHLATDARGIVQINHGLGEHGARYDGFARHLAHNGFHAYTIDHRGHGRTRAAGMPSGGWAGIQMVDADLRDLHEFITAEQKGLPVIVFGQGSGALIAYSFLVRHAPRLAGAAFWNMPAVSDYAARFLGGMLRWERFRLGSDMPSPTMRRMLAGWNRKIGAGRTDFDWLSDDPAVVNDYVADERCGVEPTIRAWLDMLWLAQKTTRKTGWLNMPRDLPLHVAHGGADPVTRQGEMVADFTRRLSQSRFSNLVSRHYPDQRHDLVNSLNRDIIRDDFVEWLEAVAGSTASP
ncbi:alpha/beta fold hydrolase [Chelativorans sp. ZYF759]|uniref:alpha/beta fold hydrolase n=1 Tax=Chelativorans sp. ZYF759 TaxID=2692213 RepID=UPI00145C8D66|nr:alpha/beta hydrolase [Chelativorans sp. ZYF759]NMG39546.1 alpha/beta fold hydrolase [Chelativorans sp. ZYF759]